jgi:hypothetical protein
MLHRIGRELVHEEPQRKRRVRLRRNYPRERTFRCEVAWARHVTSTRSQTEGAVPDLKPMECIALK